MKAKEVESRLKKAGWIPLKGKATSHKQFTYPGRPGKVTVPFHPGDINPFTLDSIEKQSGVSMR